MNNDEKLKKWWEKTGLVKIFTAFITVLPLTITGLFGYMQSKSQLKLQKQKQVDEIQMKYIDRVMDTKKV